MVVNPIITGNHCCGWNVRFKILFSKISVQPFALGPSLGEAVQRKAHISWTIRREFIRCVELILVRHQTPVKKDNCNFYEKY